MKVWQKIKEWFRWMFDRRVLDAINNGCTYEEVEAIVKGERK